MSSKPQTKDRCCRVDTMCGRSLRDGVMLVAIISTCVSFIVFLSSTSGVVGIANSHNSFNGQPMDAMNLIFSLVASFVSSYQILISCLLLWQVMSKGNSYLYSLWYISHLSILPIYFILFGTRTFFCFTQKLFVTASITVFVGALYLSVFIYFAVVVNSFMHTINQERYS